MCEAKAKVVKKDGQWVTERLCKEPGCKQRIVAKHRSRDMLPSTLSAELRYHAGTHYRNNHPEK